MNKERALEITKDRIEAIQETTFYNESEKKIADETLEYLKYIEKLLED